MGSCTVIVGDCRTALRALPSESVQCVVTSPPYWGLRDYGVDGQIGLEPTPEAWVAEMVAVFREVRRALRADGTLWLNVGDSYAGSWGNQGRTTERGGQRPVNGPMLQPVHDDRYPDKGGNTGAVPPGLKPKDLIGQGWRLAFALQADGWWLRSDIVWAKPNPMPESVTDRPTRAHEFVFLLTRSARYFYDAEAVRQPLSEKTLTHRGNGTNGAARHQDSTGKIASGGWHSSCPVRIPDSRGANLRSVWSIPSHPFPEAHFATFPPALVEPCIKAGTSERGACPACGAPWRREVERTPMEITRSGLAEEVGNRTYASGTMTKAATSRTVGWSPSCSCLPAEPVPCVVLDPFSGAGTTGLVAMRLGRSYVGCELNKNYAEMSARRIERDMPLLNKVTLQYPGIPYCPDQQRGGNPSGNSVGRSARGAGTTVEPDPLVSGPR